MKKLKTLLLALMLAVFFVLPAQSGPFSSPPAFTSQTDGTIIFASIWNSSIGSLYTWITGTLLPQLNTLTTKGDIYVYNGSSIVNLPAGGNGQVLTANSAQSSGLQWTTVAGTSPLTTKGDILTVNGSLAAVRLPVGTNGQVLTADSTQPFGVQWEGAVGSIPSGTITMFYSTYGGGIPAGWVLCDGTNGTPNLIGMIPIGGQPIAGSSSPNTHGFGDTRDGNTYGATTIALPFSIAGNTTTPSASVIAQGAGIGQGVATNIHYHGFTFSGNTSSGSIQPACMGLTFIMKI